MIHGDFTGELFGTMVLIILGDGVVANVLLSRSKGQDAGWITIATGWFIAVVMGVFVAQSLGSANADINPAVSLGKYLLHIYNFNHFLWVCAAELIGAFMGAVIVWLAYLPHWRVTDNKDAKLSVFCTIPAIRNYPSNLLCEIIGTMLLVIGVSAIFGSATLGKPIIGLAPYLVGLVVWGIGLSLGGPTGYAINPARDLAPRFAHAILPIAGKGSSDWAYAWIPVLGPLFGAALATGLWHFLAL